MEGSKKEKLKDDPPPPPDVEWTEMTRAIAQVILANLMIVGGAGSISYYCYLGYVSTGVWVGATVLATGVIGVIEAARTSYGLRYTYVIMLITSMVLSLVLFGIEVAGYVFDSRDCDKPFRNLTTTVPPLSSSSLQQYSTPNHTEPVYCRRYTYVIMLIVSMVLSLVLFGMEVAGYVFDSRDCDKPFRNLTTTVPPLTSPSPQQYSTPSHAVPAYCRMECVYIHAGLGVFSILDFAAAVVCIYYTFQAVKKVMPIPYKAMEAEPIPYKAMT